jgi:nitroreductase
MPNRSRLRQPGNRLRLRERRLWRRRRAMTMRACRRSSFASASLGFPLAVESPIRFFAAPRRRMNFCKERPAMTDRLADASLDQLFRTARSRNAWENRPLPETVLREIYDLTKFGPTSANASPARFVFVSSEAAKARLAAHVSDGNKTKVLTASTCVIIGYDMAFADHLPQLFPHDQTANTWFTEPTVKQLTAFRNGTLQGAYLMMAARALGLDCGPMSGFDNAAVDKEFFAGTEVLSNFLCAIGYGTEERLFPRSPRLPFETACKVL